jgi:hypothetical protein
MKYKVIHTGPKTHPGGVNVGFLRAVYHVEIAGVVKSDPIIPANGQIKIEIMNLIMYCLFKFNYQKNILSCLS